MNRLSILLFGSFFILLDGHGQIQRIDSLLLELQHAGPDTNKIRLLNTLGDMYSTEKPDSAIMYYEDQVTFSEKKDYIKGEIEALLDMGRIYRSTGNNLKAGKVWQRALELSESSKDSVNMVDVLNSYGYIYYLQKDFEKELSLYKRAEKIARKFNDRWLMMRSLSNIGNAYMNLGQVDSSESAFRSAIEVSQNMDNSFPLAHMADVKRAKGQIDSALYYLRTSNAIINAKHLVNVYLVDNYNLMGALFEEKNQTDSVLYYANKAFETAAKTFDSSNFITPSNELAKLYKAKNDYQKAFYYLNLAKSLTDKSQALDRQKEIFNLSFEEEQRQRELQEFKSKYQEQVKFYSVLALVAILIMVAFFLFRNNRQKQKANTLLAYQKVKIENTLQELKSTQTQLIQSEKMASLGELTAGIAHEIQNPLNFVNNFSEVNNELIEELKSKNEKLKIDDEEINGLLNDITQNLEKINHHGKRADAIVKGMLQHSRTSSGQKEPTDINALCDEYLRLAYHGLRAKDNSFNATIKADFDNSIGKINIIPQDLGRAILNLLTNAFYAVNERFNAQGSKRHVDYQPTVSVSTKKINDKVEITVADNGNGIPQNIIDKIFQPFFTTKPTGQGTGLGLSLAYDIITKEHNGTIKVESTEGQGSEFIIKLPTI